MEVITEILAFPAKISFKEEVANEIIIFEANYLDGVAISSRVPIEDVTLKSVRRENVENY